MAAFSSIAIMAAATLGAISSVQQGNAAKDQANFAAAVNEQQAQSDRDTAAASERDFRRQQSFLMAERRAGLGASGIRAGTGSPLLTSADFAAEAELQALRIRSGGETQATRLEQQAELTRSAGSSAKDQGLFRAGSSLLSGLGQAFA